MLTHEGITETTDDDLNELCLSLSDQGRRQLQAGMITYDQWCIQWQNAERWTSRHNGMVLAIGGFMDFGHGIMVACQMPSVYLRDYPLQALRRARIIHGHYFGLGVRRIVTAGLYDPSLDKWHTALGYRREGIHLQGCPSGADAATWANLGEIYGYRSRHCSDCDRGSGNDLSGPRGTASGKKAGRSIG